MPCGYVCNRVSWGENLILSANCAPCRSRYFPVCAESELPTIIAVLGIFGKDRRCGIESGNLRCSAMPRKKSEIGRIYAKFHKIERQTSFFGNRRPADRRSKQRRWFGTLQNSKYRRNKAAICTPLSLLSENSGLSRLCRESHTNAPHERPCVYLPRNIFICFLRIGRNRITQFLAALGRFPMRLCVLQRFLLR